MLGGTIRVPGIYDDVLLNVSLLLLDNCIILWKCTLRPWNRTSYAPIFLRGVHFDLLSSITLGEWEENCWVLRKMEYSKFYSFRQYFWVLLLSYWLFFNKRSSQYMSSPLDVHLSEKFLLVIQENRLVGPTVETWPKSVEIGLKPEKDGQKLAEEINIY